MIRTLAPALTLLSLVATTSAVAQEFEEGTMLLLCTVPDAQDDSEIASDVFDEAFPKLIDQLQMRANEGTVLRVHWLLRVEDGMMIFVGGDDVADAANNAAEIQLESMAILEEAIEAADAAGDAPAPEYCKQIPIGPVAVLPMK